MIRNIVFDLGGVLVDWDPRHMYRKIFDNEAEITHFLENICTYEWNLEQDRGRTIREATELKIREHPDQTANIKAYYERWHEMFEGTIEENVRVLNYYLNHTDFQVYALTNWSRETFPIALDIFPFFGYFDGIVVSGEEGFIKPDPAIYHILLDRYHLTPEECVFIDDRSENVEVAKALGLKGVHYHSPSVSLSEELDLITSSK